MISGANLTRRFLTLIPAWAILCCLYLEGQAGGDEEKNCPDCHEGMVDKFSGKYEHKPFAEEKCYACHKYHGFGTRLELVGSIYEFCVGCHEDIRDLPEKSVHDPVAGDESCTLCHEPHRGNYPALLLRPSKEICTECHDAPAGPKDGIHKPYADSSCVDCHNPHGSLFPYYMEMPPGFVCIGCHSDFVFEYAPPDMHTGNDLHSCDNCHSGHESANSHLLRRDGRNLCLGCHTEMIDPDQREWTHEAVTGGSCLDCHVAHFQKNTSSLAESQVELCGGCHDLEDDGLAAAHLGLAPGNCAECHDPHGGDTGKFMRPFQHEPFGSRECDVCHENGRGSTELRSRRICDACHDDIEDSGGHAPEQVGERTCVDCHSPHAGSVSYLLR